MSGGDRPGAECGIALGSNLGDRLENLQEAVRKLDLPVLAKAPVYESPPVDCEPDDPPFFNTVVVAAFDGSPEDLLVRTQAIEAELGRPAERAQNAPRPIDLDLLYFDAIALDSPALTLPHPRLVRRRFVLEPLAQIRPNLILPGREKSIAEELAALDSSHPPITLITQEW